MELCVGIESSLVPGFREPGVVEDTADRPLAAPFPPNPGVLEARVGSLVPAKGIAPALPEQEVISSLAREAVVAIAAEHTVPAAAPAEEVVSTEAMNGVEPTETEDDVVAWSSPKQVRPPRPGDCRSPSEAGLGRRSLGRNLSGQSCPEKSYSEHNNGARLTGIRDMHHSFCWKSARIPGPSHQFKPGVRGPVAPDSAQSAGESRRRGSVRRRRPAPPRRP